MTMIPFWLFSAYPGDYWCLLHLLVRRSHECREIWPMVCNIVFRNGLYGAVLLTYLFAFIISSVSAYFGYTVEGGSIAVGKASTDSVVMSSVLILFSDLVLTQLLMG